MTVSQKDCTLIISTYNWPEALELTLKSVLNQSKIPSEVIIADDGSRKETKNLIDHYKVIFPTKLIQLWQEDNGFRKSQILNKAIKTATGSYIIQVDGDVILHPKFIEDHLRFASKDCLLQGSRTMLGKTRTSKTLNNKEINFSFLTSNIQHRENMIRSLFVSRLLLNRYKNRFPIYFARGANISFWRADLLKINGYNENFEGWGHEDSDLTLRLLNSGKKKLQLKFSAIVYHLYHPTHQSKEKEDLNKAILEEAVRLNTTWTNWGINKLSDHNEST